MIIKGKSELFVAGEIGYDFSAENFIKELNFLNSMNEEIDVHIYSGGGSALDALAIYDFVKGKGIKFNAYISGLCGSAATIISAAANKTYIGANSFYFIHRAYIPNGSPNDEMTKTLESINERMLSIYKDLTGLSKPKLKNLLDAGDEGAFINPKDAINYGFVTAEFKEAQLAAQFKTFYNKLKDKKMNKDFNNINALFNVEGFESTDDGIFMNLEQLKEIDAKLAESVQNVAEATEAHETAINDINAKNETAIDTLKAEHKTALEAIENSNKESIDAKVKELEEVQANFDAYVTANPAKSAQKDIEKEDEIDVEKVETMKGLIDFEPAQKRILSKVKK